MISAFTNSLKIPELRQRIFFTLSMIVIIRIGVHITLPGVDPVVVSGWLDSSDDSNVLGAILNIFSGGGINNCAIFALGIMPYISASIMMQLLKAVVPKLNKLSREDGGQQKINQITRYAAIVLCIVQGYFMVQGLVDPRGNFLLPNLDTYLSENGLTLVKNPTPWFYFVAVLTMTAGTMLLMWLGEQITERGIGNGVSLVIAVNIVSGLPGALATVYRTYISGAAAAEDPMKALELVLLVGLLLIVIAAVIALTQAVRKIPIQFAKRVVGRKVLGGQASHLPLKVNYAGVMPIIFAQAIITFPVTFLGWVFKGQPWVETVQNALNGTNWVYIGVSAILIFFFSYFWVATMFQPQQIAEDLKKQGGYIPGVRPGKPTADFLDVTMSRLTFAGALFLTVVAVLPTILTRYMEVNAGAAQFFGGTSILILVGVLLDAMRHIETHLLQRNYDGFLRKGKIRGRFRQGAVASGSALSSGKMIWIYLLLAVLMILGMAYQVYQSGS
jgi:preprotein translocase subunit SecY